MATATGVDGAIRVTVTSGVLAAPGGKSLGSLTTVYDIKPDAEVTVNWSFDWSGEDKSLWENGLKLSLPASLTRMSWLRDAYFTDYPSDIWASRSGPAKRETSSSMPPSASSIGSRSRTARATG